MKFIHLSDLHLGKRVNEFSMLDDQQYILLQILQIIEKERPDAVIIAGDVYDKAVPSAEAVELFDDFLVRLSKYNLQIFIISGNHDSPERLAFGNRLFDVSGVHISPVYDGQIVPYSMEDEYGSVHIYALPFIKPAHVRRFFPDADIESYTDAVRVAVEAMEVCAEDRNILITHQFVTGAQRSESEEISVGGSDNVDASVFDSFDYVALGHIHGPQNIHGLHNLPDSQSAGESQNAGALQNDCAPRIRYCGTPLKYSFSESSHHKSVTVVSIKEKGSLEVSEVMLTPLHDMVELRGTYAQLTAKSFYENTTYCEDYVHITLLDEEDIPDAVAKLRVIYTNLMKLDYDNKRTRHQADYTTAPGVREASPYELFDSLYQKQIGVSMSDEQAKIVRELIDSIWEVEG